MKRAKQIYEKPSVSIYQMSGDIVTLSFGEEGTVDSGSKDELYGRTGEQSW